MTRRRGHRVGGRSDDRECMPVDEPPLDKILQSAGHDAVVDDTKRDRRARRERGGGPLGEPDEVQEVRGLHRRRRHRLTGGGRWGRAHEQASTLPPQRPRQAHHVSGHAGNQYYSEWRSTCEGPRTTDLLQAYRSAT